MVAAFLDDDADMACVGVLDAVVKGLLDDTIYAGPMPFGEIVGEMVGDDVDADARALGDLAALPFESGDETDVVKHGGAKEERHVPDVFDAFFSEEFDFPQAAGQRDRGLRGIGEALQIHDQRCEGLADLIVEFAGEGLTLLFLGVHQALRELLELALGVETLQYFSSARRSRREI